MGKFNTKEFLDGDPSLIPQIASRIESTFLADGYDVKTDSLVSGGADISIAKGGVFRVILGMKTALKIVLKPLGNGGILFDAKVGIFGMQVIPTIITLALFWPVLITQIWGLVRQAKLDDKALQVAKDVIRENSVNSATPVSQIGSSSKKFCTACGAELPAEASFCHHCGAKQEVS